MSPRLGPSIEKELPARPLTQEFIDGFDSIREEDEQQYEDDQYYPDEDDSGIIYGPVTSSSMGAQRRYQHTPAVVPPRRDSLFMGTNSESKHYNNEIPLPSYFKTTSVTRVNPPSPIAESYTGADIFERDTDSLHSIDKFGPPSPVPQMHKDYLRRSTSTGSQSSRVSSQRLSSNLGHSRGGSEVSTSWLNTIDESGGSVSGDSIEGREFGRRRGFDAELDAAVEAAYDDEDDYDIDDYDGNGLLLLKSPDRNASKSGMIPDFDELEKTKEMVRQVEREMQLGLEQDEQRRKRLKKQVFDPEIDHLDDKEDEDEVEESLLEDMTRDYLLDDFEFDLQSKSSLPRDPRESSSSTMSASTWVSSVASKKSSLMSHGYTSGTALQSVAELPPSRPPSVPPPPLPPLQSELPQLPAKPFLEDIPQSPDPISKSPSTSPPRALPPAPTSPPSPGKGLQNSTNLSSKQSGVRSRRLSGLDAGPLVIETAAPGLTISIPAVSESLISRGSSPLPPAGPPPPPPEATDGGPAHEDYSASLLSIPGSPDTLETKTFPPPVPLKTSGTVRPFPSSPLPGSEYGQGLNLMPHPLSGISNETSTPRSGSPARFTSKISLPGLRQINSSSSLKNLSKVPPPDMEATSPITPGFNQYFNSGSATNLRLKTLTKDVTPPTPGGMVPMTPTMAFTFSPAAGLATGGLHLFDSKLHSPTTPGSPSALIPNPPVPLEPCPQETLSRPFWLMRCLYQTIAHARGGYISARLFVPRDVWLQKGIKIKAIDDKISACDLISAALAKLTIVQQSGGNLSAIFDELQSLEGVLDRVQVMLTKKLGNEVGAAGATALYGTPHGEAAGHDGSIGKGSSGKSYLSWRKLRSKNSSTTLATSVVSETGFDIPTLPMATPRTGTEPCRPPERNLKAVQFTGPNAAYTAALARVFDAAQILGEFSAFIEYSNVIY